MKSWRENPDSAECTAAAKQNEREIFALKMQSQSEEIACPNCYGGHFRPCQWCGDTGRVTNIQISECPIGTKAPAINGGWWTRTANGWKWNTGDTFPRPGGDWDGTLVLPSNAGTERRTASQGRPRRRN